jgi:hypothetical protein
MIILILFITFMQGIYSYIAETNLVARVYSVAAVLWITMFATCNVIQIVNTEL